MFDSSCYFYCWSTYHAVREVNEHSKPYTTVQINSAWWSHRSNYFPSNHLTLCQFSLIPPIMFNILTQNPSCTDTEWALNILYSIQQINSEYSSYRLNYLPSNHLAYCQFSRITILCSIFDSILWLATVTVDLPTILYGNWRKDLLPIVYGHRMSIQYPTRSYKSTLSIHHIDWNICYPII